MHYVCARGLTKSSPRARTLGVVLGLFNLMLFPFGTALSVYTLWVLFSNEGAALFNSPRPSATY